MSDASDDFYDPECYLCDGSGWVEINDDFGDPYNRKERTLSCRCDEIMVLLAKLNQYREAWAAAMRNPGEDLDPAGASG